MHRLLVALVAGALLAGCTSTVTGAGQQVPAPASSATGGPGSSSRAESSSGGSATASSSAASSPARVSIDKLRAGECIDPAPVGSASVEDLPVVSCGLPHDEEVIAVRDLGAGSWPGDTEINARSDKVCSTQFASYVGIPVDQSRYDLSWYAPDQGTWQGGNRTVVCTASDSRGKTTGTLRGARQ
jgi:predicted small secreted protein